MAISVNVWQTRSIKISSMKVQASRMMEVITALHTTSEIGKATMTTSSCPSSENGSLKQAKRMPVRAYKLAPIGGVPVCVECLIGKQKETNSL